MENISISIKTSAPRSDWRSARWLLWQVDISKVGHPDGQVGQNNLSSFAYRRKINRLSRELNTFPHCEGGSFKASSCLNTTDGSPSHRKRSSKSKKFLNNDKCILYTLNSWSYSMFQEIFKKEFAWPDGLKWEEALFYQARGPSLQKRTEKEWQKDDKWNSSLFSNSFLIPLLPVSGVHLWACFFSILTCWHLLLQCARSASGSSWTAWDWNTLAPSGATTHGSGGKTACPKGE